MANKQKVLFQNGDRAVVEPCESGVTYRVENLVRVDGTGTIRWRAHLPENTGPDCFVAVAFDDGLLIATTWSGFRVELDPVSGQHRRTAFVK